MVSKSMLTTVKISNLPQTIVANELLQFLENHLGKETVFALEIPTTPEDFAHVQFTSLEVKSQAKLLSSQNDLLFITHYLRVSDAYDDVIPRPADPRRRLSDVVLTGGCLEADEQRFSALERWEGVRCWIMEERKRLEFWVWEGDECYKLEVRFQDIVETINCCINGASEVNAFLLRLKYGPKIYKSESGPHIASKFKASRYRYCKEDDFMWIRTTDFSVLKSIGLSTCFCLEVSKCLTLSDMLSCFPYCREGTLILRVIVDGNNFASTSQNVPLLNSSDLRTEIPDDVLLEIAARMENFSSLSRITKSVFKVLSLPGINTIRHGIAQHAVLIRFNNTANFSRGWMMLSSIESGAPLLSPFPSIELLTSVPPSIHVSDTLLPPLMSVMTAKNLVFLGFGSMKTPFYMCVYDAYSKVLYKCPATLESLIYRRSRLIRDKIFVLGARYKPSDLFGANTGITIACSFNLRTKTWSKEDLKLTEALFVCSSDCGWSKVVWIKEDLPISFNIKEGIIMWYNQREWKPVAGLRSLRLLMGKDIELKNIGLTVFNGKLCVLWVGDQEKLLCKLVNVERSGQGDCIGTEEEPCFTVGNLSKKFHILYCVSVRILAGSLRLEEKKGKF